MSDDDGCYMPTPPDQLNQRSLKRLNTTGKEDSHSVVSLLHVLHFLLHILKGN